MAGKRSHGAYDDESSDEMMMPGVRKRLRKSELKGLAAEGKAAHKSNVIFEEDGMIDSSQNIMNSFKAMTSKSPLSLNKSISSSYK